MPASRPTPTDDVPSVWLRRALTTLIPPDGHHIAVNAFSVLILIAITVLLNGRASRPHGCCPEINAESGASRTVIPAHSPTAAAARRRGNMPQTTLPTARRIPRATAQAGPGYRWTWPSSESLMREQNDSAEGIVQVWTLFAEGQRLID
jgi:hypothetical protein